MALNAQAGKGARYTTRLHSACYATSSWKGDWRAAGGASDRTVNSAGSEGSCEEGVVSPTPRPGSFRKSRRVLVLPTGSFQESWADFQMALVTNDNPVRVLVPLLEFNHLPNFGRCLGHASASRYATIQLEGLIITLRIIWPKLLLAVWHIAAWSLDQHYFRSPAPVLLSADLLSNTHPLPKSRFPSMAKHTTAGA